jgi:thiamine pyrophosphate-dependent acetolactate synthase large subunit-like protein
MPEIYGGQIVAKYIKEVEGIDTIYSLSGGHIAPIFDGCLDYDVRNIDVRHEQAAVMAAHAWSIYTGKPGVCLVTAGPGFTNSLTGVANAFLENVPVVVLSGMAPIRDLDRGALQDMNQVDMIRPVVKWAGRCYEAARIPEYLEMAFRHSVSGRPGPVFLEIPPDELYVPVQEEDLRWPVKPWTKYPVVPEKEDIDRAAELLNGAEKPLLLGGSGIAASGAESEVAEFLERTGMPFILMDNGRGAVPDEHPQSLWDGGLMGLLAAASMADVVFTVGIRLNWVLNFGDVFVNSKVIRLDIDASEVDRNRQADIGLAGDARATLKLLNGAVEKKDRSEWVGSLKAIFTGLTEADKQQRENPSDPIHPFRLMHEIRQAAGDEAVYILDGGDALYFSLMTFRATRTAGVIGSGTLFGCLGTGVPFGLGAQVALPDRQVVLVTGDGSFGLNAMEFETAIRHGIPLVCVICNDQGWGMVKHHQELCYADDRVCGTELGVIHYEKIVEALGGYGEFVEKDSDIAPAVKRALECGKPACVNVITDPSVFSPATAMFAEGFKF